MNAQARLALIAGLLAAIEGGDVEQVRTFYAPHARIWHNFDDREQTVDENLATLTWMCGVLDDRHYDVIRRDPVDNGVMQLHVLRGVVKATGEPFAMHAALVATMSDGRVTRIDEYLDPAAASSLLSATTRS